MSWLRSLLGLKQKTTDTHQPSTRPLTSTPAPSQRTYTPTVKTEVRAVGDVTRHFYNEQRFQCYTSFFKHWGGWITAGHCMTDASDKLPPFASGKLISWPDGLDAALIGCQLPANPPRAPRSGERVVAEGYPAGCRTMETREGRVYIQRMPGTWIMQIDSPDEPVVTGMSGGRIRSLETGEILGILITRNSPADLDRDMIPDQSCDFIALKDVWQAVSQHQNIA